MRSSRPAPPVRRRIFAAVASAAAVVVAATACAAPGSGETGDPQPHLLSLAWAGSDGRDVAANGWSSALSSHGKLFGLSVPGAPASLLPLQNASAKLGRRPGVVEYFQDWANPFDPVRANRACSAGVLPMLTWESWDWNDVSRGATSPYQPAYAPRRIAAGKYDAYIRTTARAMKSVNCPLMVRFDQEPNGDWYPWGLGTAGMHNKARQYVAMWRHVEKIFRHEHVHDVVWTWSPNLLIPSQPYPLRALYPGNRYVDAVGLDGYLWRRGDTPASVFGPLEKSLQRFASRRPWFVAETGVAAGPRQARGITRLLHAVAASKRLRGLIYLDQPARRADWSFDSHPASLRAFRSGIAASSYAGADH